MLEGRPFKVYTDHKPLIFAIAKISDPWSPRQQRQLTYISEFTTDIIHISGSANPVADALSRPCVEAIGNLGIDYSTMSNEQRNSEEVKAYRTAISGLKLEDVPLGPNGETLLCDTSLGHPRPVVPLSMRKTVFDAIHNLAHPSIRSTAKLVANKFVWHGLRKEVSKWSKQCVQCQLTKVQRHVKAPLGEFKVPERRFEHIHIDIVGPLPPSQGYTYLLTIVDRFSRWPEAIPLKDISALTCARALVSQWITRYGVPMNITSDRGTQFTSELWAKTAQLLGSQLHHTTAYHPQANGLVERFHRQLKAALRARLTDCNWVDELPWVLLGIRTCPKEDLNCSSAELVYGTPITVPGEFVAPVVTQHGTHMIMPHMRNVATERRPTPTTNHGNVRYYVPHNILSSPFVFIRRDSHRPPLQCPYQGPYKVLDHGAKTFEIEIGGRRETISIDRLKAAHLDSEQPVTVPPAVRRGRPPTNPQREPVAVPQPPRHPPTNPARDTNINLPQDKPVVIIIYF